MKLKMFFLLFVVNLKLLSQEILYNDFSENQTVFFNENLSSEQMLNKLSRKKIKQSVENIDVINLKKIKGDSIKHQLFNKNRGYFNVRLKSMTYKTISQSELNLRYNLESDNPIYFDGVLIPFKHIVVCIDAIYEIQKISKSQYDHLTNDVLNIWTLKPKKRTGYISKHTSMSH